jgi:hypothetical protein
LQEISPVTQWEYLKIDLGGTNPKSNEVELLNAAGYDGWELVALTSNNNAYLKRPVQIAAAPKATARRSAPRPD